jgi:lysophospholipase L1-like esterase
MFERYVAIGDSSTEGLQDRDGNGGLRGWSFRLAGKIADAQGRLLYANLAVRGATTRQIVTHQLERAVGMRPDLATVFSGTNDVLRRRFDVDAFAADVVRLQSSLRAVGATVLTFTLPDLTPLLPVARRLAPRILAMNAAVRAACAASGTRLVDFAAIPLATDPRLWDEDRIHANPAGHERIASALAEALGLPGANADWRRPLPPLPAPSPVAGLWRELRWWRFPLQSLLRGLGRGGDVHAFAGRRPTLAPYVQPEPARASSRAAPCA